MEGARCGLESGWSFRRKIWCCERFAGLSARCSQTINFEKSKKKIKPVNERVSFLLNRGNRTLTLAKLSMQTERFSSNLRSNVHSFPINSIRFSPKRFTKLQTTTKYFLFGRNNIKFFAQFFLFANKNLQFDGFPQKRFSHPSFHQPLHAELFASSYPSSVAQ